MKIVANGINGIYLREIFVNMPREVDVVKAAVAYASSRELLDICKQKHVPMILYGRVDETIPVSLNVLRSFLNSGVNYECKLVTDYYHPKIIRAENYGAYIGSANLTERAWFKNIECGIWFDEVELEQHNLVIALTNIFEEIDNRSEPLTEELFTKLSVLSKREDDYVEAIRRRRQVFDRSVKTAMGNVFEGLSQATKKVSSEKQRSAFIYEWNSTLTRLRKIADVLSDDANLPLWCKGEVSKGVVVDQFLHCYYYNRVREGTRSCHLEFNVANRASPEKALLEAISWWRGLEKAPTGEDEYINKHAPYLGNQLREENLKELSVADFVSVMSHVHAFRTAARQTPNSEIDLPQDTKLNIDERVDVVARWLWQKKTIRGLGILDVLYQVIYGGPPDDIPSRIWNACNNPDMHLPRLGLSCLGEIVGWAMPNRFPPRNNRTSKALYALGFSDVKMYGGD